MRRELFMKLRGREVMLDVGVEPPDESVGLMGYAADDICVADLDGKPLDWELTDNEMMAVSEYLADVMHDSEDDYP